MPRWNRLLPIRMPLSDSIWLEPVRQVYIERSKRSPAADEEHRQRDVRIELEREGIEVIHGCTCRGAAGVAARAGMRVGGVQSSSGRFGPEPHRLFLPQPVHHFGGVVAGLLAGALAQGTEVEPAFGVLDQQFQRQRVRALPLSGARGQQADDVADVVQPVARLFLRAQAEVFQQQRQVVRQFLGIQLEAVLAVGLDQVDHRLAAVAGFAMDVFEQQQAHRTAAVEQRQPAVLRLQRIAGQQLAHEAGQRRAPRRRQAGIVGGGQQFFAVLPQRVLRVVQQHADQLEQAHSTTSSDFSWRFGCTA